MMRAVAMADPATSSTTSSSGLRYAVVLAVCVAVLWSFLVARVLPGLGEFDAAPLPDDYAHGATISVPERHGGVLRASEAVGKGLLPGPEDLAYDAGSGYLYTSCSDGWIRRVRLRDMDGETGGEEVQDWVHVGGRPLGMALGPGKQLLIADAYKGLMAVEEDGTVRLLASEAEGLPFLLTDGVDVAADGSIYFTDASHKYNFSALMLDILEGRPHGRLLRYDPATRTTTVLLRDLYFANGVAVLPDQSSLVFCETLLRRCRRYYIAGEKKGMVEPFLEQLPGFPDNIRYDGEGHFWIGLSASTSRMWDVILRYPWVRKVMGAALMSHFDMWVHHLYGGSGVLCATLEGEALALYTDPDLSLVAVGLKGLLSVAADGTVSLLSDQAEGVPFALADGVDVAADGTVYFTDATHKYNLSVYMLDALEGRPHGRLLRYDPPPPTRTTTVLRDLYFANGVAVSPDQASVIFCETPL